ncbi:hypothetical protein [Nocardia altamirensis]|uniref:hypothetical protein n=1 Tax=Nocardia altamirensis TaxID=472158 RepID=UPI00114C8DD4|nr:hypothetical protein [Nocardia altamirensis]
MFATTAGGITVSGWDGLPAQLEIFTVTVTVGSETVPDMRFYGGLDHHPIRREIQGWGVAVELAGVMQMLDAITTAKTDIGEVRAALVDIAETLERKWLGEGVRGASTPDSLRCFGDCPRCEANVADVRRIRAEVNRRRERYQYPDRYPYAVSGRSVHRITCREVKRSMQSLGFTSDTAEDEERLFRIELRAYTHTDVRHEEPRLPLTPEEFDRWRAERVGPQGGLRYQPCKICNPDIALA